MFPLYFPQVANEYKVAIRVINIIVSYVAGEQLITPMKAQPCVARVTSLPSCTIDRSTVLAIMFLTKFCVCYQYINSDSGLLFIMCGHCCKILIGPAPKSQGASAANGDNCYCLV